MDDESRFFELLAASVACGATVREAAPRIGCSESHAYTLSARPSFKRRVAELRTEAVEQAVGKLSDAASQAVDTLVQMLGDGNESKTRLAAAKAILASLKPVCEFGELRDRIDRIEAAAASKPKAVA